MTTPALVGTHDLDIYSVSGGPEVATFGNQFDGVQVRFYDMFNQNGVGGYVFGMSNSNAWLYRDNGAPTTFGIGTSAPRSTVHIQGGLMTSNITTYNSDSNIYFSGKTIAGISNLVFTGSLINQGSPFVTSQWITNQVAQNAIGYSGNVAIGSTGITTFGTACNLLVVGNMFVTGSVSASTYVNPNAVLGVYTTASIFQPANDGSKTITTNDTTSSNCVLYSFSLNAGRYLLTATVPYQNITPMMALDTANWGSVGLYQATPQTLTTATVPLRYNPINAIGSYISTDLESITFSWFLDTTTINQLDYVIAVFGKGHQLKFAPAGYNFPTPTLNIVPIRGIGYDDVISVRQALQINPIRYSEVLTGAKSTFILSAPGYLTSHASNIDIYDNGVKLNYLDNTYSLQSTDFVNSTQTNFTIVTTPAIQTGRKVDISIWPTVNPANSSYYSSGFLYQQINTSSTPWLNVVGGGVRLGNRCVIDGDLYVKGNIWGGCNTNSFISGVQYTGAAPFNVAANTIGTTNLIDGAVTSAKLNITNSTLNVGKMYVATNSPNGIYNFETTGLAHVAGGAVIDSFVQTPIVQPTGNFLVSVGTSNSIYIPGTNSNTGFVGINTLNPQSNLHVFGNMMVQSTLGSNVITTNLAGNIGIGTNTPQSNMHLYGNMYIQSTTGQNTLQTDVNGNVSISGSISAGNLTVYRNRIINGDMRIDQRFAAAETATTTSGTSLYFVDRFYTYLLATTGQFTVTQVSLSSADTPYQQGFRNSLRVTASTAVTAGSPITINGVAQGIEINNIIDLNWGTSFATTVTLSFWARSTATGAIGVTIGFTGITVATYYVTSYSQVATNTWQYVTLRIPPPPTGTLQTNQTLAGITVNIGSFISTGGTATVGWSATQYLSSAINWANTLNNTLEVTGVQFEKGTISTPFEFRPFTTEFQLCQRYYETSVEYGYRPGTAAVTSSFGALQYFAIAGISSISYGSVLFKTPKRTGIATGNITAYAPAGTTANQCTYYVGATSTTQNVTTATVTSNGFNYTVNNASTGVAIMSWVAAFDY